MSYQWTDILFPTRLAMLDAIAEAWLTAGGNNSRDDIAAIEDSDEMLAGECIRGWGLNRSQTMFADDPEPPSHMQREGYTQADLAQAFGRVRPQLTREIA